MTWPGSSQHTTVARAPLCCSAIEHRLRPGAVRTQTAPCARLLGAADQCSGAGHWARDRRCATGPLGRYAVRRCWPARESGFAWRRRRVLERERRRVRRPAGRDGCVQWFGRQWPARAGRRLRRRAGAARPGRRPELRRPCQLQRARRLSLPGTQVGLPEQAGLAAEQWSGCLQGDFARSVRTCNVRLCCIA